MSTTRAGTIYKTNPIRMEEVEQNSRERGRSKLEGGASELGVTEVLRMFAEDRRQLEEEQSEERRRWQEEKRVWEIALEEERRRREEEMQRREEYTQRQMTLVQGVQLQGEAATKWADSDKDVKVPKLTENDDIVVYMTTFERLMVAYEVKAERWVFKLATNLVGKAQQAYAALTTEDAMSYEKVKEAILQRYNITSESYRQRFRALRQKTGESGQELVARLDDLAAKWLKSCKTPEEIRDKIILEQFLNILPEEVRIFVKERKPESAGKAGKLVDDFVQARKPEEKGTEKKSDRTGSKHCLSCGKQGHFAKDCRMKPKNGEQERLTRTKKDLREVECFNCHKKGHYSSNCPRNAMYCMERRMNYHGKSFMVKKQCCTQTGVVRKGVVEGKNVDNILLDTGCSRTLVHHSFVPEAKIQEGRAVAIRCAHGDTVLYPLANISLEVEGQPITVEAAVANNLPMSVLLGTDNSKLPELLKQRSNGREDQALAVITRAEGQKQKKEEERNASQARECGVQPNSLDVMENQNDFTSWMEKLDEEMFSKSKVKKKSRKEKRAEKWRREELDMTENYGNEERQSKLKKTDVDKHELDITAEEMKMLQATDPTLRDVRLAVKEQESKGGVGFFSRDSLLYRRWKPRGDRDEGLEQLVLPKSCRKTVLEVAHSVPLGGHLGRNKTTSQILQRFYWPTMYQDIAKFCRTCEVCQKTCNKGIKTAPLIPLPVISQPFERIAMDIVGPLPKSNHGNRFVLVICDYATRYPEAVPLRYIDAASVAEELLKLFSRVGVPKEILTDQGTNFTSQLLIELYRMLHVQPIRTTPYHPQTDGLVERFNRTLKSMLRKATDKEGKDWDTFITLPTFCLLRGATHINRLFTI